MPVRARDGNRGAWLLDSPIAARGGTYLRSYGPLRRGPVYGEITAYAISMACVWYRRTHDARYLERARRSAAHLLEVARPALAGPPPDDGRAYTFDTGILAGALLDLYAVTDDAALRAAAAARLDWLLACRDGDALPATVPEEPAPGPMRRVWPLRRAIHLGKLALPFLKGWRATGTAAYRDAAARLLAWALPQQRPDGRFPIAAGEDLTLTHAHCYVTEGLLYAAAACRDETLTAALGRAADWLAGVQNPDGSFYKWYPAGPLRTKVSDATAQALRIWRILKHEPHAAAASRAAGYLERLARPDGGLPNHVRQLGPLHYRQRRVYAWPTFFWHHAELIDTGRGGEAPVEELF